MDGSERFAAVVVLKTHQIKSLSMAKLDEHDIAHHIENLETLGFAHLPGFMDQQELETCRTVLQRQLADHKDAHYPGYSEKRANDPQLFNLQNKDSCFLKLLSDPSLEKILMGRLNDEWYPGIPEEAPNYILGEYIARKSGDPLRLHIDSWMPSPGDMTWMMQVVFVMHDRGPEEGCTTVVPGSHISGKYSNREYQDVQELPVKAGDVAIWDSRLWHGARANTSGKDAWVLVATLQRWWVKQRFDLVASMPENIYNDLSDRERALIGYCSQPPKDEFIGTDSRGGYERLPREML